MEAFSYNPAEIKINDGSFMVAIGFDDATFCELNEKEKFIEF